MGDDKATVATKLGESLSSLGKAGRKLIKWSDEQMKEWESCPNQGELVPGTPFLPLKVPLSTMYETRYDEKKAFTISSFIEGNMNVKGTPIDVGLVFNATGSDDYYHDTNEWADWDVKYVKLPVLDAKTVVPPENFVKRFFHEVYQYTSGPERNRNVAVFDTRGYNRAGYLFVSYLVEYRRCKLDHAVAMFTAARPPGIYCEESLKALYRKYFSTVSAPAVRLKLPKRPAWDTTATQESPGTSAGVELLTDTQRQSLYAAGSKRSMHSPAGTSSSPLTSKKRRIRPSQPSEELPPLDFGTSIASSTVDYVKVMATLKDTTGMLAGFPGTEAVSLQEKHLASGLPHKDYLVSWRARGRRCLLIILKSGVYILSRDSSIVRVEMLFPKRTEPTVSLDRTIVDGVLVQDKDGTNIVPRYLAFDLICLNGIAVWKQRLDKRLQYLQNEVVGPRKQNTRHDYSEEPMKIRVKDQYKLSWTSYTLKKFCLRVTHEAEGVIFTPIHEPYNIGGYEKDTPILKFTGKCSEEVTEERMFQYLSKVAPEKP